MKNEGYLSIDHRASPGLTPEDFRKAGITGAGLAKLGLDMAEFGEGKHLERATKRCCHCGNTVVLNQERIRNRSHCRACDAYICDDPKCHFDCRPFRKMLDKIREDAVKAERIVAITPVPDIVTLDLPDPQPAKETIIHG